MSKRQNRWFKASDPCSCIAQKLQDGLSLICDASNGLIPFKTWFWERKNRKNEKTKTIDRELNVNSLKVLHVLRKSLVELHSRGEQLDLIRNFVSAFDFFQLLGQVESWRRLLKKDASSIKNAGAALEKPIHRILVRVWSNLFDMRIVKFRNAIVNTQTHASVRLRARPGDDRSGPTLNI
jgi:hypothetical protein